MLFILRIRKFFLKLSRWCFGFDMVLSLKFGVLLFKGMLCEVLKL